MMSEFRGREGVHEIRTFSDKGEGGGQGNSDIRILKSKFEENLLQILYLCLFHYIIMTKALKQKYFSSWKYLKSQENNNPLILKKWCIGTLGRVKKAFSSETIFLGLATTFSHYLGLKHCRKPKIENFYEFFHPAEALRSFTT